MLQMPADFVGTKGIIHPDDLEHVKETISLVTDNKPFTISFRIITTYGEVKTLHGDGVSFIKEGEENFSLETQLQENKKSMMVMKSRFLVPSKTL